MPNPYTISELGELIAPIARKHGVKRISVFGSVAKGTANFASDVDLCIDAGEIKGLLELIAFRLEAEEVLHTSVDVITTASDDKEFLEKIKPDEVTIYEQ